MSNNILYILLFLIVTCTVTVVGDKYYVEIDSNAPVVQGGEITFRAKLRYKNENKPPEGTFTFEWTDDAINPHYRKFKTTKPEDSFNVTYPAPEYSVGDYKMRVTVSSCSYLIICLRTSARISFSVTSLLNGVMNIIQDGSIVEDKYIASKSNIRHEIVLNTPDADYLKKNATSILTYWFVDCVYYGVTSNFTFDFKYDKANEDHNIEALVVVGFEPITTPAPPTTTTTTTTTKPTTTATTTTTTPSTTTLTTTTLKTTTIKIVSLDNTIEKLGRRKRGVNGDGNETNEESPHNILFPYVCMNQTKISADPKKVYGYFSKSIITKDPIRNISTTGNNWQQPGDVFTIQAKCDGSPPFTYCVKYKLQLYNVTNNETCTSDDHITSSSICDFPLTHYYTYPGEYTILIIVNNLVTKKISPITVNVYKGEVKNQLSVIVVPVSFSLIAVVLIVFGIAYYIQNRRRFTVEVANFDFGQQYTDMEYKTFQERLRDSISNAFTRTSIPDGSDSAIWPPSRKYGSMT